jgi:hypothetical protein
MSDLGTASSVTPFVGGLLQVALGGTIGLIGGFAGPYFIQRAKDASDTKRKRAEKFEELVAALYEHRHWLDTVKGIRAYGRDGEIPLSPFTKACAISIAYFPYFDEMLCELEVAAGEYETWMFSAANKRLANDIASMNEGVMTAYAPYARKLKDVMKQLQEFGRREFQSSNSLFSKR